MSARLWAATAGLLLLTACAHAPRRAPTPAAPPTPAASLIPEAPAHSFTASTPPGQPVPLNALPGWAQEDHAGALLAYQQACGAARDSAGKAACQAARQAGPLPEIAAEAFLSSHFSAQPYAGQGVLTAYFAPTYEARRARDAEFSAAVRPRPADLPASAPSADRAAIEAQPVRDALAWMRPEDLFFLQIQGSGLLTFADSSRMKAVYAATNNQPFVAIARPMREQGLLAGDNTSGDAIRAWLAAHRGAQAQAVMNLNGRYVFFQLKADDGGEAVGAAGVALPAGRAIAIDPAFHDYGEVFWLDAGAPILAGAFPTYRRMVTALDTGSAIRGEIRADLYLGTGDAAGVEAGRVRHDLVLYRLAPTP